MHAILPNATAQQPTDTSRPARVARVARFARAARRHLVTACVAAVATMTAAGCEVSSFLDPTVVVDPKKRNQLQDDGSAAPVVGMILNELDLGVSQPDGPFADARDVRADDLQIITDDYIIGPGDQLRVTVNDYPQPGAQFVDAFEVTTTGFINLPDVREVPVEGLTETETARAIEQAYVDEQIFVAGAARVNVLAFTKQNRTFTIVGTAVGRVNTYIIARPDFRILDAMALAGAATNEEVLMEFAYVIRRPPIEGIGGAAAPAGGPADRVPAPNRPVRPGADDPLSPRGDATDAVPAGDLHDVWAPVFAQATGTPAAGGSFEFEPPAEPEGVEVIRVPIRELLRGQLKFNVVIRPGDTVLINGDVGGVYYVYGDTLVPGVYQLLPQNPVTLKRAIASARGFTPVAVPQRTQLVRKYGDQDVFVRVDLRKIFIGESPDLVVKPGDMIMVGTNFPAPFLAALRNGFRVSYGFGFLYDRNFARQRNEQF